MKKRSVHFRWLFVSACVILLLTIIAMAASNRPVVNNEIHFRMGAERTAEPFNFFQDTCH